MFLYNMTMKNTPIDKDLILNSTYYKPVFKNEHEWKHINTKSWYDCLYYTYHTSNKSRSEKVKKCAIDIGAKVFLSVYGTLGTCYKLKSDYKLIDDIIKCKHINHMVKNIMIEYLMNEMHTKAATFICNNFDIIYIGYVNNNMDIKTETMIGVKDNLLKILGYNQFLITLRKCAKKYKKTLRIVDESYTSVQCTSCGEKNVFTRIIFGNDFERRKYTCNYCNYEGCRDVSASRSILIKNEHYFKDY